MKVTRVELRNFKPYREADVSLGDGVTVIHGPNGAGKSSLLEAAFFALYGSKALETGTTLEDIVTNGEDETEIEIDFSHAGSSYRIERRIRRTDDRAQTADCVLETPSGTIEGDRDVRRAVRDLLRMDAEAFVNCAYVRQGEVNKLINASPGERQDMLDDLLQLGTLETYRERANEARLGVNDVRENAAGNLGEVKAQIEKKAAKDLPETLNELESERNDLEDEIKRYEANLEAAEERLDEAETILEEHEDNQAELDDLEESIESLREAIAETEAERDELRERIADRREANEDRRDRRDDLLSESELDDVDEAAIEECRAELKAEDEELTEALQDLQAAISERVEGVENRRTRASELDDDAADKRETADELEAEVADAEDVLADRRDAIDDLADEIDALHDRFDDAPIDPGEAEGHRDAIAETVDELTEDRTELVTEIETRRNEIGRAEELLEAGKCPECGQPVEGAPHVDTLDEDREALESLESRLDELDDELEAADSRLDEAEALLDAERELENRREKRDSLEQLIEEKAATLEDKRERIETLREDADALEADAEEKRREADELEAEATEKRAAIGEHNKRRADLREAIDRLDELAALTDDIESTADEIESLREKRALLEERNDERRETLQEKRDRKADVETAIDEDRIEWARNERDRAADYIENATEEIETLREQRDELQSRIGAVENELSALEELRDRRDDLAERVAALESLQAEADEMESMYGDLRAELRQRNLASLERLLNETFDLIYQNDAYARIELDHNYDLTVYQKDGEVLEPEQLSGGERALFNLSLRTAIYRLLAEGIEGAAPMPPLILDEPTVFLDAGHVSRLVELVESMRDLGVEQIVVVSHDDELVGAADDLLTVEKDATSNRSSVRRAQPSVPAD